MEWIYTQTIKGDKSSQRCSGYLEQEAAGEADGAKGLKDKAGQ